MSTYPKGSRESSARASRLRKRKFHGKPSSEAASESIGESKSARKLASNDLLNVLVKLSHFYRIIEFVSVFLHCKRWFCAESAKKNITFHESGARGLGFKIAVKCACGTRFIDSGPFIRNGYEINTRIIFVMRLLGASLASLNVFISMMDLGKGLSEESYSAAVKHIHEAAKNMFNHMCLRVVKEERAKNEKREIPCNNFTVSGDGTWKKRGFTSLFGVTSLIAYYSDKVIDLTVKSSFCKACSAWKNKENTEEYQEWYETHKDECSSNHTGSAGKMEIDSVKEMFSTSLEKYGVRYLTYIGDGDSKTFKSIKDLNPYKEDFPVRKSECVNHIEKRMGTRLRNVRKEKKLEGKGKLTEKLIKKLTAYYSLAIMRNSNSVENMQRAIMAVYFYSTSTDQEPRHENCPPGEDSWCKYRRAESLKLDFTHPEPLHQDVAKNILPIFEDLSREELLERCLGGHTQNANESFNATIWRLAPKHLHCGRKSSKLQLIYLLEFLMKAISLYYT